MRSAAAAIAWEFRQRHRWGLVAVAAYLLVLAAIRLLILGPDQRVSFDDDESFALAVVVPLTATFMYFLAVFSFGLSGDLAARRSMYPARMFTLPVSSAALAGWPMLYGTAAMTILWLATRLLGLWPAGYDIPMIWPALLAGSLLAWTQALTWTSYPLPGLRVIVTVLWLAAIDSVIMLELQYKASEPTMLAILAPHVPLAFLVARLAVARARRGDVPDWQGIFSWRGPIAESTPRRRDRFPSAARAQLWFEWRQYGRSLPALVGILLPFELALLFLFRTTAVIVFEILFGVLFTPVFMAAFAAATVSRSNPQGDSYGLTPFIATRPLTSPALIVAKLKATVWSTLAAWLLVLVAIPLAVTLSGTWQVALKPVLRLAEAAGAPRATLILLLALLGFMVSTWKQLVQNLYIGLTGRDWVIKSSVFLALSILTVMVPVAHWISRNRDAEVALWNAIPAIAAVLVCVKILAAVWIAARLHDKGLLSDRALLIGAASWDVAVFMLFGILAWLVPDLLMPRYLLALIAILGIPLARLSAAPLAIAWSRHR
jgi:hypothetical protein